MQDRTGLTVFLVRVVFVLFETRRFCKVARFVFPDLEATSLFSTLSKFSLFTFIFGNLLRAYDSFSVCKDSCFSGIPYAYILK